MIVQRERKTQKNTILYDRLKISLRKLIKRKNRLIKAYFNKYH